MAPARAKVTGIYINSSLAKVEAVRNAPELFADDYPGGYEDFRRELVTFLEYPRRFIYTPLIMCKGKKPT